MLFCWTFTRSLASFCFLLLRVPDVDWTRPLWPSLAVVVFPLLRLVVLVNGLGIGFLVLTRILISDLNQLSAECKISLLSGNVFSVCCPDAGVGRGVLDVFGLSGAGFVRLLDRPDQLVLWV